MGLFSFLKGKGKKVGAAEAGTPPTADEVKAELQTHGLVDGLEVEVEGDKVRLLGTPGSAEQQEKAIIAAGNIEGIAEVEDTTGTVEPTLYTVESGDTLSGIAKKTMGDANLYTQIFEANRPMLSDPDKIYPGQVLRIPTA